MSLAFAGDSLGQQRLSGTGRPEENHSHLGWHAHMLKKLGVTEGQLYPVPYVGNGFVLSADVVKAHRRDRSGCRLSPGPLAFWYLRIGNDTRAILCKFACICDRPKPYSPGSVGSLFNKPFGIASSFNRIRQRLDFFLHQFPAKDRTRVRVFVGGFLFQHVDDFRLVHREYGPVQFPDAVPRAVRLVDVAVVGNESVHGREQPAPEMCRRMARIEPVAIVVGIPRTLLPLIAFADRAEQLNRCGRHHLS